jgi:hypothetical protein
VGTNLQYIALQDEHEVGRWVDLGGMDELTRGILSKWLEVGFHVVVMQGDQKMISITEKKAAELAPKPRRAKAEKKTITTINAKGGWTVGDKCYLAWSRLDEDQRRHLTSYCTSVGRIEEIHSGLGLQKAFGVRFNEDPKLLWLKLREIARAPEGA